METASKKPRLPVIGAAQAGLGEVYAREDKVPDANAAYDAAAKADPSNADLSTCGMRPSFSSRKTTMPPKWPPQMRPSKIDPNQAILYYIKGQGLVANATVDPKTQRIILPPDCTAAYQKYLELAARRPLCHRSGRHSAAGGRKNQLLLQSGQVRFANLLQRRASVTAGALAF